MQSRRKFIKISSLGLAGVCAMPSLLSSCVEGSQKRLTILHTNDMHSRIEPFPADHSRHAGLGGMSRRASLIKRIRSEEENVMLLDSGDIFQGTPYFNYFSGELELKLMSEMGYEATTVGNHEFDNGLKGLFHMMPVADFPYLTANYDFSKTIIKGSTKPYQIFDKEGLKIGVFGLGVELDGLVLRNLYGDTKYLDPVGTAKEMVEELQANNCDLIVCLSHLGYEYKDEPNKVCDINLAKQVDGIDLILGGHTHTYLDEPTLITNAQGHETIINQVGWAGTHLGRIDFVFDKKGKKALPFFESSIQV